MHGEIKDIRKKQPENNFKSEIRNSLRVALNVDDVVKKKKQPNSLPPQYRRFFRLLVTDEPTGVTGPGCLSSLSRKASWH